MSVYRHIFRSALLPAYYGLKGRGYSQYKTFLEQSQWWPPSQLQRFQWQELRHLLSHVYRTVPYYKDKYSKAGIQLDDLRTPADFARLPPLTRSEVNAHRRELCSTESGIKLLNHATGGSFGIPTRFFITIDSYDWRCAASERAYSWAGHGLGERTFYLWGAPVGKTPAFTSAKMSAYRFLRREVVIPTFAQTTDLWQETHKSALRFKPKFIVGYVSSLEEFAEFLISKGLVLKGVEAVIAAAEPVSERTRQLADRAFAAPLFNTYGSREFMSIAAECEHHRGLHINSENLLVEAEQQSSEIPSEFLVTDLHNYGMPFVRYRIGDMGILSDSVCPCGRGLPLISSVEGRARDVLRTRSGRVVSGIFFPHMLKDISEVSQFQVEQPRLDEIVLSIVLTCPLSDRSQTLIRHETSKVFGEDTRVVIKFVETIPHRPSGKRRLTVGLGDSSTIDGIDDGTLGR